MPDRTDSILNAFANFPQLASPVTAIRDADESTGSGHYATAAELTHSPELEAHLDSDPLYSEPEKFIVGYLAARDLVGMPYPLPGPVSSYVVASAPIVLLGHTFIPSVACTVQLFDGRDASGRPALQLPIPAAGVTALFGRILFPHGLYLQVTGAPGATVDGGFIVERRVDSIPR